MILCGSSARDSARDGYTKVSTGSFGASDNSDLESANSDPSECEDKDFLQQFEDAASQGELDFYTAVAVSMAVEGFTTQARDSLLAKMPTLIALQCLVPAGLLSYQIRHWSWGAKDDEWEFRMVGFIVYLYSVWNMYNNSSDECRSVYIRFATDLGLPTRLTWIAILGEIVNSFCGFALVMTLFTVFCISVDPFNLVINCIAINFLGSVDNEFVDDDLKRGALKNARRLLSKEDEVNARMVEIGKGSHQAHYHARDVILNLVTLMKTAGTLGFGSILAVIFLFAKIHQHHTSVSSISSSAAIASN